MRFEFGPRYNIAPGQKIAVVTEAKSGRELDGYTWGLIPSWAKEDSKFSKPINARAETLLEKPTFRGAIKQRRCLIPADGFYEWHTEGKIKTPHHIHLKDGRLFAFAGLWEEWHGERTCAIITTEPNSLMERIHNRMPVILPPDLEDAWLDPSVDAEAAMAMLKAYPAKEMEEYIVDKKVGNVAYDAHDLIEPAKADEDEQMNLFD